MGGTFSYPHFWIHKPWNLRLPRIRLNFSFRGHTSELEASTADVIKEERHRKWRKKTHKKYHQVSRDATCKWPEASCYFPHAQLLHSTWINWWHTVKLPIGTNDKKQTGAEVLGIWREFGGNCTFKILRKKRCYNVREEMYHELLVKINSH